MRIFTPFSSDDEIIAIANGFLDRSLPKTSWTHAAHFSTTLWIMRCGKDLDAARDLPHLIRDFNAAKGGANTDTEGYHETITQASVRAARAFLNDNPGEHLHALCNALMGSALGQPGWLLAYWSRPCLFSVAARRTWVDPDIKPLPF
ncbi:MAG TPA: hypothetical protein VGI65_05945 [Steroidobacteraceae bacterium]